MYLEKPILVPDLIGPQTIREHSTIMHAHLYIKQGECTDAPMIACTVFFNFYLHLSQSSWSYCEARM